MNRIVICPFKLLALAIAFQTLIWAAQATGSIEEFKLKLKSQHEKIEKVIANPPSRRQYPADYDRKLREWQDDLAQSFAAAADTVNAIIKLNPPDIDLWRERLETLHLYSQPVTPPSERNVFGAREVDTPARILDNPAAEYTDEARHAKAHGDVRLRLVFAADGAVRNVFPIKSLGYGLTDSAMKAARQIRFEPAVRNGRPASQFVTLVYEFEKGASRPAYIPRTEF